MSTTKALLVLAVTVITLTGCEGVRDVGRSFGAITARDIREAENYRKVLPGHLGLAAKQVRVEPGSGVTLVIISGVNFETERQRLATELATLNTKNPQLSPLKWRFQ